MADSLETTTPTQGRVSVCKICGKLFNNPQLLSAHKRMVHPGMPGQGHATKPKGIYNKAKQGGKFVCNICGMKFPSPQAMGSHKRHTHPGQPLKASPSKSKKPFACPECGERYSMKSGLGIHRRVTHGITGTARTSVRQRLKRAEETTKGIYKCPECGVVYKFATGLGTHRLKAHGVQGTSYASVFAREQKQLQLEGVANNNGNSAGSSHGEKEIDGFTLGHTVASIQSLIAHICEREAILPNVFTARIIELLSPAPLRKNYRSLRGV